LSYINDNYSNPALSLEFISNHFGVSSRYVSKFFKNKTGKSLSNYLTQFRIEKAKTLLTTTKLPITAIYSQCGFISEKTFFRCFAKYETLTPGKYREQNQI
jgi:two-component system response regulator YesN